MAVMSVADRGAVRSEFSRVLSEQFEGIGLTKAELLAAVDATDLWISDNQASYNAALPLPSRTVLTASQKARLFTAVAAKRFDLGT